MKVWTNVYNGLNGEFVNGSFSSHDKGVAAGSDGMLSSLYVRTVSVDTDPKPSFTASFAASAEDWVKRPSSDCDYFSGMQKEFLNSEKKESLHNAIDQVAEYLKSITV